MYSNYKDRTTSVPVIKSETPFVFVQC